MGHTQAKMPTPNFGEDNTALTTAAASTPTQKVLCFMVKSFTTK
jgi:hypothetical protein